VKRVTASECRAHGGARALHLAEGAAYNRIEAARVPRKNREESMPSLQPAAADAIMSRRG
jgi:hypothetical protein